MNGEGAGPDASRSPASSGPGGGTAYRPLIGVLGGMGPAATVDLYAKLVNLTPAGRDQEHVRVLIDGDPEVPDRQAAGAGTGASAGPAIVAKALRLKAAGAEVLAMACNAAHTYQEEIVEATGLPFVSLVDAAVEAAARTAPGVRCYGLLATPATLDARLYERALGGSAVRLLTPDDLPDGRNRLMNLVWRVKSGDLGTEVRSHMAGLAEELVSRGAGAIVAACTEVPLVLDQAQRGVPMVDAAAALAVELIELGAGHRPRKGAPHHG